MWSGRAGLPGGRSFPGAGGRAGRTTGKAGIGIAGISSHCVVPSGPIARVPPPARSARPSPQAGALVRCNEREGQEAGRS